ncbi:hypothetical protein [Halopenitus sp. POP-27]|uniref:hypothetical protein n=1 Tax=Halopenitus sp. POP-27 TaxID=2994425 RepID=UPI0024682C0E|nr:hypothetical protein [Halopenitus sp. POP-27]
MLEGSVLSQSGISENYGLLAPIVLLVVVELSQLARTVDLEQAVERKHHPLILDAFALPIAGILRFILGVLLTLFDRISPWNREKITTPSKPDLGVPVKLFYPRLGSFSVIHTANVLILLSGIYITRFTVSDFGIASGPILFALGLVLLPIFEVSEYDLIAANYRDSTSFSWYMYENVVFFLFVFTSGETGLQLRPGRDAIFLYVGWFLTITYVYLVLLAKDIRTARTDTTTRDYKGIE